MGGSQVVLNLCNSTSSFVSSGISPSLPAISSKFLQISLNNIVMVTCIVKKMMTLMANCHQKVTAVAFVVGYHHIPTDNKLASSKMRKLKADKLTS